MNYDKVSLGRRIREERELWGLSREKFSEVAGISKSMLTQMENNKRNPSNETLGKVADAIKKPPYVLLMEKEDWVTNQVVLKEESKSHEFIMDVVDYMLRLPESEQELIRDHSRIVMNYHLRENNS